MSLSELAAAPESEALLAAMSVEERQALKVVIGALLRVSRQRRERGEAGGEAHEEPQPQ